MTDNKIDYKIRDQNNFLVKIKFDEFLFIFGVVLMLLAQLIMYIGAPYFRENGSNVVEQLGITSKKNVIILYIGYVCLLLCAFFNLKNFAKFCKKKYLIGISLFIVCLVSVLHYIIVFLKSGLINSIYESTSPIIYLLIIVICIAFNKKIYNIFLKMNNWITLFSLIMAIYFWNDCRTKFPNAVIGNSGYMKFYIQAFFSGLLTCYTIKSKKISYAIILLLIMLSFLNSARSYIIQSFLFLIIFNVIKSKRKVFSLILSIVLIVIIFVLSINIMKSYFPNSYDHFINKLLTDTRSSQYEMLFKQIEIKDLIYGRGFYFTYFWDGMYYAYIDNVYIFALIRYGVVFLIPFMAIILYAFFSNISSKIESKMCLALLIFQWLLAYAGLAVYVTIELDYKMVVLYMVVGNLLTMEKKYEQI